MTWTYCTEFGPEWWQLEGKECFVTLESRPHFCDRGRWIAKVFPEGGTTLDRDMDRSDGWPRYYFDLERAKAEVEAWMERRGQQ